jgi:hypothetical protein
MRIGLTVVELALTILLRSFESIDLAPLPEIMAPRNRSAPSQLTVNRDLAIFNIFMWLSSPRSPFPARQYFTDT